MLAPGGVLRSPLDGISEEWAGVVASKREGHIASRVFTPEEQDEMVREGEDQGVRARNFDMLYLGNSMYENLQNELNNEDQAQQAAESIWW